MVSPFVVSTVNDVLFQTNPDFTSHFFEFINIRESHLADTVLHDSHHHHHRQPGLNARWCLTPFLLSLPTAAYLGQRGLTPAGLSHTTAQCHLTILGEAVLFCLNHLSFRTPGSLSFCCRSFFRYARRGTTFSVSLSAVGFLSIEHYMYKMSYFILSTFSQVVTESQTLLICFEKLMCNFEIIISDFLLHKMSHLFSVTWKFHNRFLSHSLMFLRKAYSIVCCGWNDIFISVRVCFCV